MLATWRPGRVCWGGAFAALTMALQLWPEATERLRFSRPVFTDGAVWQLLTAQWVHLSVAHAAVNAMAAVLLCWTLAPWVSVRKQLLALLGGYVGVAMVLALDSNCLYYAGASGALHGVLGGAAVFVLTPPTENPSQRWLRPVLGAALFCAVAIKLLVQPWVFAAASAGWLGVPTYYPAHTAGAAGGAVAALLVVLLGHYGQPTKRKPR